MLKVDKQHLDIQQKDNAQLQYESSANSLLHGHNEAFAFKLGS